MSRIVRICRTARSPSKEVSMELNTHLAEKLLRHGVVSVRSRTGELAPYLPQFRETEDFMAALALFLQGKIIDSAGENGYHIK